MLKQRLIVNQGPTQRGRTRYKNGDVVMRVSDYRDWCGELLPPVLPKQHSPKKQIVQAEGRTIVAAELGFQF